MITLKRYLKLLSMIKESDYNDEYEIILESYPKPHFIIQEKLIRMEIKNGN